MAHKEVNWVSPEDHAFCQGLSVEEKRALKDSNAAGFTLALVMDDMDMETIREQLAQFLANHPEIAEIAN